MRRLTLKGAGESGGHSISTQKSIGCEQTPGAFCVPHGYVVRQQVSTRFFFVLSWFQSRDVFIKVLEKKRDKLTLSHIKIAIRQCYSSSQNNQVKKYMSEQQREELIAILKEKNILQKEISLLENM